MNEQQVKIAIFQHTKIRKQLHNGEWWFVIVDVVVALTDSNDPAQYIKRLRTRDEELARLMEPVDKGAVQFVPPLFFSLLTLQAVSRKCFAGVPKGCFAW